jgi:hypothetical protein
MTDKPNFILVPDDAPPAAPSRALSVLSRLRTMAAEVLSGRVAEPIDPEPPPTRPRLVFAVDATASREPAWAAARKVTDALVKALPGELDVALAVHGGGRMHTFTPFTTDANPLRDRAAAVSCEAGFTRLLPILDNALKAPGVRVVIYIGDVFEESLTRGRRLADSMGARGARLIVLHDTADPAARQHAEIFWDLAKRTGGCVLPFDAAASRRLHDLVCAVAVYAVGGERLLQERRHALPGAVALLESFGKN